MKDAHLSDKEIYSVIIEPETADRALLSHLKACRECRNQHDSVAEFTRAFREHIEHIEIDWTREKGRILSAISDYRVPPLWWRRGAVAVVSCIVIIAALSLRHLYFQPNHDIPVEERELLTEAWISTEGMDEVEVPQGLFLLTHWDKEDFPQFLEFFSPIEEENNEKSNLTGNGLSNVWVDDFPAA